MQNWPGSSRSAEARLRSGTQVAEHKDKAKGNMPVLPSGTLPKFTCRWVGSFVLASWEPLGRAPSDGLSAPAFWSHDRGHVFRQHITDPKHSRRRHAK